MPEKHHYFPVFYQKRWAGPDGRVCVYGERHNEVKANRRSLILKERVCVVEEKLQPRSAFDDLALASPFFGARSGTPRRAPRRT